MQKAMTFYYKGKSETNTLLETQSRQYCTSEGFLWCKQEVNSDFLNKFVGEVPAILCLIKTTGGLVPVITHGDNCLIEMQNEIENEEQ